MSKALEALKPPPFEKWRKPIKAAVAMLIGCIMTFSDRCREAIGSASLLVAISVVFYFPFKTVGVVFEVKRIHGDETRSSFLLTKHES